MASIDDVARLEHEIEKLEAQVKQLAREALKLRPRRPEGAAPPDARAEAYARAIARYETVQRQLLEKKNEFRRALGLDPLAR